MSITIEEISADLAALPDWEDKYLHLIELGRTLPDFPEDARIEANRVHGCQSRVWLIPIGQKDDDAAANGSGLFHFLADSDSQIVRGLIVLVRALFDGKSPSTILSTDEAAVFASLGLDAHLSPGRRNGLRQLVLRVKDHAQAMQQEPTSSCAVSC